MHTTDHKKYMQRCIQLAKNGLGTTYPNPLVGCVIVHNNRIIGEGWHKKAGEPHAEVNAINAVEDQSLLPDSILYVSLEPCSHHGRTPPCSDLIVRKKIKSVVIGSVDFNSKVYGKGIEHLKKNGCSVETGILEKECRELNKRFFTFHLKKRPFIILKWAETLDGYFYPGDERKNLDKHRPVWITNQFSLQLVHKYRTEEQGILVGTKTVLQDNPKLNAREYYGNDPMRLVIDRDLKINNDFSLKSDGLPTVIFTEKNTDSDNESVTYKVLDFSKNIPEQICDYLYNREIQSVIIEGGVFTLQAFIDQGLWDEARVFTGDVTFGSGLKVPVFQGKPVSETRIKKDILRIYRND